MRPDELLLALHDAGITLAPHGDRLHVDAPKGVVTIAMAAALKEHKARRCCSSSSAPWTTAPAMPTGISCAPG